MSEYINKVRFDMQAAEDYFAERLAFTLGPVELKNMLEEKKAKLIDVRAEDDFYAGHIPQAISIPKQELPTKMTELSKEHVHVVYCYNQQCHLAAAAALVLAKNGYPVMELEGGFKTWVEDFGFEVEK